MIGVYTTTSGDTWDVIAKKVYGDELCADYLMQCNPDLLRVFRFREGIELRTPALPQVRTGNMPPWR